MIGDFDMPLQRSLLLSLLAFTFFDNTHEGNRMVLLLNIRKSGLRSSACIFLKYLHNVLEIFASFTRLSVPCAMERHSVERIRAPKAANRFP